MPDAISVTEMLSNAHRGDERSMAALLPLVYDELKMLASRQLDRQPGGGRAHTLQPTALVHEAFLKMVGSDKEWSGRDHFMAVAAKAMRHVLVDHARKKTADIRGGANVRANISLDQMSPEDRGPDLREMRVVELDALLTELSRSSERAAVVAEMRLFGGMEQEQIARVLDVSRMTVHRDWQVARAWLAGRMRDDDHD